MISEQIASFDPPLVVIISVTTPATTRAEATNNAATGLTLNELRRLDRLRRLLIRLRSGKVAPFTFARRNITIAFASAPQSGDIRSGDSTRQTSS
jgi:hypothetical protein